MNISSFTKWLLEILSPGGHEKINVSDQMTAELLLSYLKENLKKNMFAWSLPGKAIFPMRFHVLMHPTDYEKIAPALQMLVDEFVIELDKEVVAFSGTERRHPHPAKQWYFTFTASDTVDTDQGAVAIPVGNAIITSQLFYETVNTNAVQQSVTNLSFRTKSGNMMIRNINLAAVGAVEEAGVNTYRVQADDSYQGRTDVKTRPSIPTPNLSAQDGFAIVSYMAHDGECLYPMITETMRVSGIEETRNEKSIFIVKYPGVKNDHLHIRYLKESNEFELIAYGNVKIDGKKVPLSSETRENWVSLPKDANILLNANNPSHSLGLKFHSLV